MTHNVNVMSELDVLYAAMQVGWVKFSYYKADGTKRVAIGTRNRSLIEKVLGRKLYYENKSFYDEQTQNGYFDLSRIWWRRFNPNRFIGIDFDNLTNEQAVVTALSIIFVNKEFTTLDTIKATTHYADLVSADFLNECMPTISYAANRFIENLGDASVECENVDKIAKIVIGMRCNSAPAHYTKDTKVNERAALIAELKKLRKRESEILGILLGE